MLDELYPQLCEEIEASYRDLGHQLGWRFLTCPRRNLAVDTRVALITLNPGGDYDPPEHPRESCESGSAYLHETWNGIEAGAAPLQVQVQRLFEAVNQRLGHCASGAELLEQSLSAQFIPFRSPSLRDLVRRRDSERFAVGLWTRLLHHIRPTLILCIDKRTSRHLTRILEAKHQGAARSRTHRVGWGRVTATVTHVGPTTIVRFPHLSRYRIFGRRASAPPISGILDDALGT